MRLKILTEEGKRSYREQKIVRGSLQRLSKVDGRTILADGRVVPLPEDAVFEERRPHSSVLISTRLVFPAVEVGAILDYRYTLRWDHPLLIPPWYFQREVPTLLSEVTYVIPTDLEVRPLGRESSQRPIPSELRRTHRGKELRLWLEDTPGITPEPHGLPGADIWSRMVLVPAAFRSRGERMARYESWKSTCRFFADNYRTARRADRRAREKARELAAGEGSRSEKIAAVHAFVRDEIETEIDYLLVVHVAWDTRVDAVLAAGRGRPAAKALLLLQSMLDALDVDSDLVWVADRRAGRVDFEAPRPGWFDAVLVRVEVDRQAIYLDPINRSVGLGHIAPHYEGTRGLLFHPTKPRIVELPASTSEDNRRRAVIDLEIGDDGRVEGAGTLELAGHPAGQYLGWEKAEAVAVVLRSWLAREFMGYDVSSVEVEQDLRRRHVRVGWSLEQRQKPAPGGVVMVLPSRPLGPMTQLFTLPPRLRRTPVLMDFGRRDDLVLNLRWPPGWEAEALPEDTIYASTAGQVECRYDADEVRRTLTFRRRFELASRQFASRNSYRALRDLYHHASEADARSRVVVRRKLRQR